MKKGIVVSIVIVFFAALVISIASQSKASAPDSNGKVSLQEIKDLNDPMIKGQAIYEGGGLCSVCHQVNGQGMQPVFPPLAQANYLLADKNRAIRQTLYGSAQPIEVNGVTYPGNVMTPANLTDEEVMLVVNYILNSWGNDGGTVTLEEVKAQRQ